MAAETEDTYGQILKSTSIIGGASGINLIVTMLRIKSAAVLIGPVGVGLIGTYQAIQGMVGTFAGLGIQQSAVREIAEAVGRGDNDAIGRTILSLRRMCLVTGLFGMMAMIAFAVPLSEFTFDSDMYSVHIALLGPIILLANIQGGQSALLQGMRRIGDIARQSVVAAVLGTVVTVALYAWLGMQGIVPSLLLVAVINLVATWYFARRVTVQRVEMTWKESFHSANNILRLGLVFMSNGVLMAVVAYLTRAWISQELDLIAVGIFTAAFSLSGMFINVILGAMGVDYYPRLTAASRDHTTMRKLVNEQTEIGLLISVPALLATLTLTPWIIRLFYSGEFLPAADLLQWFTLGCLGRVISWPLGFIMLALSKSRWLLISETMFNLIHLGLIWLGITLFGLEAVAFAFFLIYSIYIVAMYAVAKRLICFRWSREMIHLLLATVPLTAIAFAAGRFLTLGPATGVGILLAALSALFSLKGLISRLGVDSKFVQMGFLVPGVRWFCSR